MHLDAGQQVWLITATPYELAATIEHFHGVKSATVLIDIPDAAGLGAAVRKPTASATVFTDNGRQLPMTLTRSKPIAQCTMYCR